MIEREVHGVGGFHGRFRSATLRECLDRISQSRTDAPATSTLGSMPRNDPTRRRLWSPNVEGDQTHESTSVKTPSPDSESQPRIKEERKAEDVTPKSEAAPVGAKDEPAEPDSEDSLRPEQREELCRLITEFPPSSDSTPRQPGE